MNHTTMKEDTVAQVTARRPSIYENLRAQILDGRLSPGTPLVEANLAADYGVSRSPIREALAQLSYEGLLERHGRAMQVRILKPEDVLELYEVRLALERAAARAAAERRTDLDLGRLTTILDDMSTLPADKAELRPKHAHSFHFELWRASHNATLIATLESVQSRVQALSSTTLHYPERWTVFVAECAEILAAVRDRDIQRAGEAAEKQITSARDFRLKLYSRSSASLADEPAPGK